MCRTVSKLIVLLGIGMHDSLKLTPLLWTASPLSSSGVPFEDHGRYGTPMLLAAPASIFQKQTTSGTGAFRPAAATDLGVHSLANRQMPDHGREP
jgi:hypothetical protein